MPGQLVTVATFDLVPKARLAQNILEMAGIKSVVTDENIVAMDWLFGNAVGWVKVQVLEEDADRAVAELEEAMGTGEEPAVENAINERAMGAVDEESRMPATSPMTSEGRDGGSVSASISDEAEAQPSERDDYARRLYLAAVFSVVFPPLWFYSIYLLLNAAFGEGPINKRGRSDLRRGGFILGAGLLVLFAFFQIARVFIE